MYSWSVSDIMSFFTEENIIMLLEQFRSYGPLPGILITFLKSFIPPLPTLLIVGANGVVYGWAGFIYSWIGLVGGSFLTFLIIRRIAMTSYIQRWAQKPKVQKSLRWIQRNAFSYVFLLGMFPMGPFVLVNMAAGAAQMRPGLFLLAAGLGKGIMIFYVTYIGTNLEEIIQHPLILVGVVIFIILTIVASKRIEAYYTESSNR
ncbi:TVP38/TMEM64 family protein [Paenibacillus urinalis]|uniref:TVP38/TMEM64 family membrane protein n=1 Tax=Paenibacillus urinalis TaxID=521520 RepID=A0AAX3N1D5_9BACL|nr:TVP38/TMEM64 family protein [Paenibacillus urinalis]WDH82530.1 TVP38/TMEM64 family protein [Paenibacillus urinalis]WDH98583.1 TVP38/TMEM64 family protein [Paenibacillus urinalis]WDI02276.1 TVP38/TMEM64 family protein [Paenibacillus urinalis]